MENKSRILAVGVNPAWQKVLQFEALKRNAVNRAYKLWSFASGKGVNFARAARIWNSAEVKLVQFAGGGNGKLLLNDLAQEKLDVQTFDAGSESRCCITCLSDSDNSMSELIEPSLPPELAAQTAAADYIKENLPQYTAMALCGQLPAGMDIDFYVQCAAAAARSGKLLLIDSWKNIQRVLAAASENTILKINSDELNALTGISCVEDAVKMLMKTYPLKYMAITAGSGNAFFADRENIWQYQLPHLEKVVNPVGSGDTASAVLLSCMASGMAPSEAFARALSAASANCLTMKCGEFDRTCADKLFENIKLIKQ